MGETTVRLFFYHVRWAVCVLAVAKIFMLVGAMLFDDILFGTFDFATQNGVIDSTQFARDLLFWIGVLASTIAWHVRSTPQGFERIGSRSSKRSK